MSEPVKSKDSTNQHFLQILQDKSNSTTSIPNNYNISISQSSEPKIYLPRPQLPDIYTTCPELKKKFPIIYGSSNEILASFPQNNSVSIQENEINGIHLQFPSTLQAISMNISYNPSNSLSFNPSLPLILPYVYRFME